MSSEHPSENSSGVGTQQRVLIPCPVRRAPLFAVVPDGIEIRCRSCRGDTIHRVSRAILEQIWSAMIGEEPLLSEQQLI